MQPRVVTSGAPVGYPQAAGRPMMTGQPVYQTAQPMRSVGGMMPQTSTRVISAGQPMTAGQPQQYYRPATTTAQPVGSTSYISSGGYRAPVMQSAAPIRMAPTIIQAAPVQVVRQTAPNLGPQYTQQSYEDKHKDDVQLQNLKELRKTSGLKDVPVKEGLLAMNKGGGEDGKLTREQFLAVYAEILASHGIQQPTDEIRNAVFDLFDRDDNGIVDMMELICGISLLCSGSEEDKIHAVFEIFDQNGDGFISMDEMFMFLTSVFKVVLTPNVMGVMNSMGVTVESAEDLASVTALECFKTADLNHDGKLSIEEFKNWFYAPRNDPSFLFSPVRKLLH